MRRAMCWVAVLVVTFAGSVRGDDEQVVPASGFRDRLGLTPPWCTPVAPVTPCPPGWYPAPGTLAPSDPTMPPPPQGPAADLLDNQLSTPFATQTGGGGVQGRAFNEAFDGDFGGVFYRQYVVVGTRLVPVQTGTVRRVILIPNRQGGFTRRVVTVPVFTDVVVPNRVAALVPVAGRYSGIQITDNDSPRPTDRVYFGYSFYDQMGAGLNPGVGSINQNRQWVGFEKTFLDGDASIGLRLPFVQLNGPPGTDLGSQSVGDLSVLLKYAFVNDPMTGNVLSAGFVITTPTSEPGGLLSDGTPVPHSVLLQPWLGFVRAIGRGYVQGITDLVVPTDGRDVVLLSNSLGVGYWLYRADGDRLLTGIIPTAEVHVRTPLNNRDPNGVIYLPDMVNLTGGAHFRFPRATLSGAVCVPVVGPRPWNVEATANLTFRF